MFSTKLGGSLARNERKIQLEKACTWMNVLASETSNLFVWRNLSDIRLYFHICLMSDLTGNYVFKSRSRLSKQNGSDYFDS